MKTWLINFRLGFFSPLYGWRKVWSDKRLRHWGMAPFILTSIVFLAGFLTILPTAFSGIPVMVGGFLGWFGLSVGSTLFSLLKISILIVLLPTSFVAICFLLFMIAKVFLAPFYSFLAEKTLILDGHKTDTKISVGPWLLLNIRMLIIALIKAMVFSFVGLLLFILSFIPGVGLATSFGFLLIVSFDLADYSFESLQFGFRQRIGFFLKNILVFSGIATGMGLVFLVPGLNFFLLPAAVVGVAGIVGQLSVGHGEAKGDFQKNVRVHGQR